MRIYKNFLSKFVRISAAIFLLSFQSCSGERIDQIDIGVGLSRSDVEEAVFKPKFKSPKSSSKEKAANEAKAAPLPKLSKLMVSPPPPSFGGDKIISFSATDQVPLKDVLIEFGRMVNIDVDVDPAISGSIIINAKNKSVKEVIDRIATLGNLRYSFREGVLRFERDAPYIKNYYVDYLSGGTVWGDVESGLTAIIAAAADDGSSTASSEGAAATSNGSFTANKSAGIISVFATQRQQKAVETYLADIEKYASSQVLIEAKVVEVSLKKGFSAGIDWTRLNSSNTLRIPNGYAASAGAINFVIKGNDLNFSMNALETFGSTRAISSPRIHATNNQKAVLNFTDKLVYFQIQQTQSNTSTSGGDTALVASTLSSTKLEENTGVTLDIVPSINVKTNEITLSVKPKLAVVSSWVVDPASPPDVKDAQGNKVVNQVPVIQTRELSTSVKIQSGNVFVIGGLMKDSATGKDSGVPFINRIPVIGWLFKSMERESGITETVIFIKATIVNSGSRASKVDRGFHDKIDPSRRPYFGNE